MAERQSLQHGRALEEELLFSLLDKQRGKQLNPQTASIPTPDLTQRLLAGGEAHVGAGAVGGVGEIGPLTGGDDFDKLALLSQAGLLGEVGDMSGMIFEPPVVPRSSSGGRVSRPKSVPKGEVWFRDVPLPGGRVSTRQIPPGSPVQEGDYRG